MEANRKKHRVGPIATLTVTLLAYPLSSGPAIWLVGATGPHPAALFAFKLLYAPLALLLAPLPKSCDDAVMRWLVLWDFYGVF
jgi:hypothetical protein